VGSDGAAVLIQMTDGSSHHSAVCAVPLLIVALHTTDKDALRPYFALF
jgi:hypothetical protein